MKKLQKLLLFLKLKFSTSSHFPFKKTLLDEVVAVNRRSTVNITNWISDDVLNNSYFRYGVPDYIRPLLDKPIDNNYTYTDFIVYYSKQLNKPVSYLELGVSVGKNFYQLMNVWEKASIVGFDIENINPTIEQNLELESKQKFKLGIKSIRTEDGYFNHYTHNSNKVSYLAGDIYDETCWQKLQGKRFNVIFSDALHDPKALLFEYEMIKKYNLLDDDFLFFWDDLNHGLEKSFYSVSKDLKNKYELTKENIFLVKVNGWLGQHEISHDVGLVTNIDLN